MAALTAELKEWLAARTAEERESLLNVLAFDAIAQQPQRPLLVRDENNCEIAVVKRIAPNAKAQALAFLSQPHVQTELNMRIQNPGRRMDLDEFMDDLSTQVATKSRAAG